MRKAEMPNKTLEESKENFGSTDLIQSEGRIFRSIASKKVVRSSETDINLGGNSKFWLRCYRIFVCKHEDRNRLVWSRNRSLRFKTNLALVLTLQIVAMHSCVECRQLLSSSSIRLSTLQSGLDLNIHSHHVAKESCNSVSFSILLRGSSFAADPGRHIGIYEVSSMIPSSNNGRRLECRYGGAHPTGMKDTFILMGEAPRKHGESTVVARLRRPPKLTRSIEIN